MESRIEALLAEKFTEEAFKDCFVVEVSIQNDNKVAVFVDSDSAMTFKKCQQLSRHLEAVIDEEQWFGPKYTLEVSSPGLSRPLKFVRQYQKNVGRPVKVKLTNGSQTEGLLTAASDTEITLEQKVRVKEGKKKVTKIEQQVVAYTDIKETKVKITFNK